MVREVRVDLFEVLDADIRSVSAIARKERKKRTFANRF